MWDFTSSSFCKSSRSYFKEICWSLFIRTFFWESFKNSMWNSFYSSFGKLSRSFNGKSSKSSFRKSFRSYFSGSPPRVHSGNLPGVFFSWNPSEVQKRPPRVHSRNFQDNFLGILEKLFFRAAFCESFQVSMWEYSSCYF